MLLLFLPLVPCWTCPVLRRGLAIRGHASASSSTHTEVTSYPLAKLWHWRLFAHAHRGSQPWAGLWLHQAMCSPTELVIGSHAPSIAMWVSLARYSVCVIRIVACLRDWCSKAKPGLHNSHNCYLSHSDNDSRTVSLCQCLYRVCWKTAEQPVMLHVVSHNVSQSAESAETSVWILASHPTCVATHQPHKTASHHAERTGAIASLTRSP